jgi:hypothetical protein
LDISCFENKAKISNAQEECKFLNILRWLTLPILNLLNALKGFYVTSQKTSQALFRYPLLGYANNIEHIGSDMQDFDMIKYLIFLCLNLELKTNL